MMMKCLKEMKKQLLCHHLMMNLDLKLLFKLKIEKKDSKIKSIKIKKKLKI
jgi:hypothetical protein